VVLKIDGKGLAHMELNPGTAYDLWTAPLENDDVGLRAGKPEPVLQTPSNELYAFFSPDGRWLAYASNESKSFQLEVRAFLAKGGKWPITTVRGGYPMWSRSRRKLFFESPQQWRSHFVFLENFFDELMRRAAEAK